MLHNLKIKIRRIVTHVTVVGMLIAAAETTCQAQNKDSLKWGEPSSGVQVSISLTNGIVTNQIPFDLVVKIRNISTNAIHIAGINPVDPLLILTNDLGKGYTISLDYWHNMGHSATANFNRFEKELIAGEVFEATLPVKIDNSVDAGSYQLQAFQHFITAPGQGVHEVASNRLKIVSTKNNEHP